jgi:probable HAF family extracellular repeat protein
MWANDKWTGRITGSCAIGWVAALAIAATPPVEDPLFVLEDLGTLGGRDSVPLAMNDVGQVVGWSHIRGESMRAHAFLWEDGVMRDLGTLGGPWSEARGINDDGIVVGVAETPRGVRHAFYAYDGRMWDLNDLVPLLPGNPDPDPDVGFGRQLDKHGAVDATPDVRPPYEPGGGEAACSAPLRRLIEANAVSPEGVIAACGEVWADDAIYGFALLPVEPFHPDRPRYTYVNLGLLAGADDCFAYGVNGKRQVVGRSGGQPFIWDGGIIKPIDDMLRTEFVCGEAIAINELAVAAGYTGEGWVTGPKACIWRNGRRYDLSAEGPGTISMALGLNDRSQVVGWKVTWDSLPSAMLWDCACVPLDLNRVTEISPGTDRTGFTWARLSEATAIDERGCIAGLGDGLDGRQRAFLLRPTSPAWSD